MNDQSDCEVCCCDPCMCPDITSTNASRSQQQTQQEQTTQSLINQLTTVMTNIQRDIAFRSGQVHPNEVNEYGQWLNRMQDSVIQRDRYYPDYQEDWGVPSSGGGSVTRITGSATPAFTTVFDSTINGMFVGGIRPTGVNGVDARITVTSFSGTIGVGAIGTYGAQGPLVGLDNGFVGLASAPFVRLIVDVRRTVAANPANYELAIALT